MPQPVSEKYKVGLTMTTNGRTDCLKQSSESLKRRVLDHWSFDYKCVIDDSGSIEAFEETKKLLPDFSYIRNSTNLGLAQTVHNLWESVPSSIQYIFHIEDDFTYNNTPRLDKMLSILLSNDILWQIVLKRQPVSAEEVAGGGYMKLYSDQFFPSISTTIDEVWMETQLFFSLNPSIIPREVFRDVGWPVGNEAEMTQNMKDSGRWSAFLGSPDSEPEINHIGHYRSENWKL